MAKKAKKLNMTSDLAEKDPIMKLGYGITAYRNLMWAMIIIFSVLTIINIPAYLVYAGGDGYTYTAAKLEGKEKYSLGNLGYSTM